MAQQDTLNRIINRVNDFNRRVRDLEEKIRNINARVNTIDDTLLEKTQNLSDDIQDLEDEIEDIRDRLANMEVDIKEINRDKRKFVTKQQLEEVENYIDLMNPIESSFMTEKEVKKLIANRDSPTENEIEEIIDRKIKRLEDKPSNRQGFEQEE